MLKVISAVILSTLIFAGTLYFLLVTFVKKPEGPLDLRKEYTYINRGDESVFETFYISPHARVRIKLLSGEETVYDQLYIQDEFMLRVPMKKNESAKLHAIVAGCSFTWGEGLQVEDTLPWRLTEYNPDFQGYNHSFPGGGIHSLLRYHDFFRLSEGVKEKEGYFFYTFIPTHMERYFVRYNFLRLAPLYAPYYETRNGKVVYAGEIKDSGQFKTFQEAQAKGLGDTLINTQDPMKWDSEQISEFVDAVQELKNRYLKEFPRGKFFFLFHPVGNPPQIRDAIIVDLKKRKIDYIDLSHEFGVLLLDNKLDYPDLIIKNDGHPNAIANDLGAKALLNYLKKAGQNLK